MARRKTRSGGGSEDDDETANEQIHTFNADHDADLVLSTSDEKDIWVHKFILRRASTVFRDMFQGSAAELKVPISEPADIIIDILQFMYPDFRPEIWVEGTWKNHDNQYPKRLAQIERFRRLVELTVKYDMPAVQRRVAAAASSLSESCPADCVGLSARYALDSQLAFLAMKAAEVLCKNRRDLLCSADIKRALKIGILTGGSYYDLIQDANDLYDRA